VRLTTSPPSCAECHEIWETKPPGTLWATPGLLSYMYGQLQVDCCCIWYERGVKVNSPDCIGSVVFSAAGLAWRSIKE
jgi:hypothetical protein